MNFVQRRIDQFGRILIPIDFRSRLGLQDQDLVNITCENGELKVKKSDAPFCVLCRKEAYLPIQAAGGRLVCHNCARYIQSQIEKTAE